VDLSILTLFLNKKNTTCMLMNNLKEMEVQ
jgi:hypothetical protein